MPYAVIEEKYTDNTVNGTATLKELNMLCKTVTPRPCWDLLKFAILFFKFVPKGAIYRSAPALKYVLRLQTSDKTVSD